MKKETKQLSDCFQHTTLEHEHLDYGKKGPELLEKYNLSSCQFFTVILRQQYIEREKFENTPFVLAEYQTLISPIRREAYALMEKRYSNNYEWVEEIINRYYPKEETDSQEWYKEFDLYIESLLQSHYPEALDNLIYEWAFYEKFTGDPDDFEEKDYQRIVKRYQNELHEYKKSLFYPIYEKIYRLNYQAILPPPLGDINHSCPTKQFYFIHENGTLHVAIGCSCGSGTRHTHGLYGHFFTLLQNQNIPITSFITEIDSNCQFKVIKQVDHLILYRHDLIGNYRLDGERVESIFKGIELYL